MSGLLKIVSEQANNVKQYLTSPERKQEDVTVGIVALTALSATALISGAVAYKQRPIAAVGIALSGIAGTALYGMQQLSLR